LNEQGGGIRGRVGEDEAVVRSMIFSRPHVEASDLRYSAASSMRYNEAGSHLGRSGKRFANYRHENIVAAPSFVDRTMRAECGPDTLPLSGCFVRIDLSGASFCHRIQSDYPPERQV